MTSDIRILQANVARRREAQLSLLNDDSVQEFAMLMITEPSILSIDGKPVVNNHTHWNLIRPTSLAEDHIIHSFRSLIFVHKGAQFRQIQVPSSDITAGILFTNKQRILAVSIYVPRDPSASHEENAIQLSCRLEMITRAWEETKRKYGRDSQLLVAGDFNRYDQF